MANWLILLTFLWSTEPTLSKADLLGKIDPEKDTRFVKPDDKYTKGSARSQYLRKETYEAFQKMQKAAQKEGVSLFIVSATRTFSMQKAIWERKWNLPENAHLEGKARARQILLYSSMPGTSRHHWGTDIDLNDLSNAYFTHGNGLKEYEWLKTHAHKFGFCQTYTNKSLLNRKGYEEEKWHWSYLPLAKTYLTEYLKQISAADITGFQGDTVVSKLPILEEYVQGVACH